MLEANTNYWDPLRFPRIKRIIFDNTLDQKTAVELVKTGEGRVDMVTELRPLETLRVAQSPFAKVVKNRGSLVTLFGQFNMRKTGSPWKDVRVRRAMNFAINREDLIRYAAKGNGVIIPALLPRHSFGYNSDLAPYPFDPSKARQLLREAGYPNGLPVMLIASEDLVIQATVVSKMLEQVGLTVDLQILDSTAYSRKIYFSYLDQPPEQQPWDIALTTWTDPINFPLFELYNTFALEGVSDWVVEEPELRRLAAHVAGAVESEQQQGFFHQMERHTRDQAYFLFLYNPIQLYAVNKAVKLVPYVTTVLYLAEASLTEQHWSMRKQKAVVQE